MKKIGITIGSILGVAAIGGALYFGLNKENSIGVIGGADGPTSIFVSENNDLDKRVSDILLSGSGDKYLDGECSAEGHIILGAETEDNLKTVYALTMYGEYGFQDNNFVKVSGSGVIPAVIKILESEGKVILTNIIWPKDGSEYEESIKEMFPEKYHKRVVSINDSDRNIIKSMEEQYAKDYLIQIGRNATIGKYGDFEHVLLTQAGVDVKVSNKLLEKNYANYPFWIGNQEKVEDGVRYIYQMDYDKEQNQIILSKSNYETKEIVEKITIDSLTGEEV